MSIVWSLEESKKARAVESQRHPRLEKENRFFLSLFLILSSNLLIHSFTVVQDFHNPGCLLRHIIDRFFASANPPNVYPKPFLLHLKPFLLPLSSSACPRWLAMDVDPRNYDHVVSFHSTFPFIFCN